MEGGTRVLQRPTTKLERKFDKSERSTSPKHHPATDGRHEKVAPAVPSSFDEIGHCFSSINNKTSLEARLLRFPSFEGSNPIWVWCALEIRKQKAERGANNASYPYLSYRKGSKPDMVLGSALFVLSMLLG